MKKSIIGITLLTLFLWVGNAWAPPPVPPKPYLDTNCNQSKYFPLGSLCQDTDDGKLYKGTGAAVVEIAAGGAGDMTLAAFDADLNGKIDGAAGGSNISTAGLTGTPYVTAGVWSVEAAAAMKTNLGLVIGTNVQAWDADLDYLATFTPTANVKTILNAANFAAIQGSLSIDDLITLSGVLEGAVNLGAFTGTTIADNQTVKAALQALETSVELKANTASPTLTGTLTVPAIQLNNSGLRIFDTDVSHSATFVIVDNLTAAHNINFTTGDADVNFNQNVSSTGNPAFSTLNLTGANALNVGTSRTNDGTIRFKSGTALNDFYHEIRGANFTANTLWILPPSVPGGANFLLNVDADGTMGYTDPATFGAAAGDVASVGDCTSGACGDGTADGGTYIELYGAAGNTRLIDTAGVFEVKTAAGAAYANVKIADLTINIATTGILKATSGVVASATAGTDYPGLASANTFTGNNIFGDADTDLLGIRSLIYGGNSRAVQITDSIASPTYATGTTDLYVKRYIESAGGMYAPFFDSVLTAGNVGYVRVKEDPTNGTNYRGFTAPSALSQDLSYQLPDGNPAANDIFVLGAPSLNVSALTHSSLVSLMDTVLGSTRGSILYRGAAAWTILTPGTSGHALFSQGAGADPHYAAVTAAAAGAATNVQYNTGGVLDAEAAFSYNAGTNTLTVDNMTGVAAGNIANAALVAKGDLLTASAASTAAVITDVAAGQPLLSGGIAEYPAYAGYTFSGTAAQIYTFPSVTASLAPLADPVFTGSLQLPNGANPTTDATGEIAMDTSSGAGGGLRIYTNATPGAVTIPIYISGSPIVIKDPTSASDYPVMYTPYAITIRAVHYLCVGGTNWVGQLQECDADGANCVDTQAADTTALAGTTNNVTSFSNGGIATSVWLGLKTTSVSGSPTSISIAFEYTVDQSN